MPANRKQGEPRGARQDSKQCRRTGYRELETGNWEQGMNADWGKTLIDRVKKDLCKKVMEQQTGIEAYLDALEMKLVQEEEQVRAWLKRAVLAQDFDEACRLKEVQWALQECIDKINPHRKQQEKREERIRSIFRNDDENKKE